MRISDWSSDVCSSDLGDVCGDLADRLVADLTGMGDCAVDDALDLGHTGVFRDQLFDVGLVEVDQRGVGIGVGGGVLGGPHYLPGRKSVGWGKCVSVRVALGGSRIIQKKKKDTI